MPYHTTGLLYPLLRGRLSRVVANNTKVIRCNDWTVRLRLHDTDILTEDHQGRIHVKTGGHRTAVTMRRINQFLQPRGLSLRSVNSRWVWWRINSDGTSSPYSSFDEDDVVFERDVYDTGWGRVVGRSMPTPPVPVVANPPAYTIADYHARRSVEMADALVANP